LSELLYRPRPSLSVVESTVDRLIMTGPNYSVTFNGTPIVGAITALLDALAAGAARADAVRLASTRSERPEKLIEYAFDLLESHACLYSSDDPTPPAGALDQFVASTGQDPEARRRRLAAVRALLVVSTGSARELSASFDRAGVVFDLLEVGREAEFDATLASYRQQVRGVALVCSWGFAYRGPFARRLNELAIELGTPIVFGACEGLVGRIGPHVIPGASACLECHNRRSLSNAGAGELDALLAYRRRWAGAVEAELPAHPAFAHAVAELFALETSQILSLKPPQVINAVVQIVFGTWQSERHNLHRVPRCDACRPRSPERLAWDAQMVAPKLKTGVV
jgi:bacteriocin biosynthesis cyclodehydratase domain-containing protein